MSVPVWEEHGPEAAATVGRWTDERYVVGGEGGSVTEGRDGDTYCLHIDSATAVDLFAEDDADERDWRRASRVLRFASAEDRETYVSVRWGEPEALQRPAHSVAASQEPEISLDLNLYAGQTNTQIDFSLKGKERLTYSAESIDLPRAELQTTARSDEVERFVAELRLLGASSWRQFEARAVDGLLWTLTATGGLSVNAGGANAYPPHGEGRPTPTFGRLLLAAERLLGRELWLSARPSVLETIPDPRDRVEHLILAACRSWSAGWDRETGDPAALTERKFQKALHRHLLELTQTDSEARPSLADWDPGNVDFVLEPERVPTWLELKWCKRPSTFGQCLWDAAKVAAAVRQGRARHGYLLVGAPAAVWEGRLPLEARVTGVSAHPGTSLVDDYPSWWGWWCEETRTTYPRQLPTPVMTTPVGRVRHFGLPGSPWELRLIRAEAPGGETYAAPCPERPAGRAGRAC